MGDEKWEFVFGNLSLNKEVCFRKSEFEKGKRQERTGGTN